MSTVELSKIQEVAFDTDHQLIAAAIADTDEWVLLADSGQVFRYKVGGPGNSICMLKNELDHNGKISGFDLSAPSSIYLLDEVVVVVNDFKQDGRVYRPGKGPLFRLWREDYHADISKFPIALYKGPDGQPGLIHGVAWNKVEVLSLATLQNLTAAKSLIVAGEEERDRESGDRYNLSWPRPFNYFFGALLMSPDRRRFLSNGWAWGSCDTCYAFEVEDFISNHLLRPEYVGGWEHDGRGICWMDNNRIAVLYNAWHEGNDGSTNPGTTEVHRYDFDGTTWRCAKETPVPGYEATDGELAYSPSLNLFAAFTLHKAGFTVFDPDGRVLLRDPSLIVRAYHAEKMVFATLEKSTVTNYVLVRPSPRNRLA